jgi:hypothetical protein
MSRFLTWGHVGAGGIQVSGAVYCPLCGICPSRSWTQEDDWRVFRCSGCDLLITWPRPDDATLARIYGDQSYYQGRSMVCSASAATGFAWV